MRYKDDNKNTYISRNIRTYRIKCGYSQQQLADMIGITKGAVSAYEQGKIIPSSDKLNKLALLFGIPVTKLTDAKEDGYDPLNSIMDGITTDDIKDGADVERVKHIGDRYYSIGKQIRDLRQINGMSSDELAKKLNLKPALLVKYEQDKHVPSYSTLIKMAKLFNVSTDWLLGVEGSTLDISDLSEENRTLLKDIVRQMKCR